MRMGWEMKTKYEAYLKLNLGSIQRYTPITLNPTAPCYNIIKIFDTVLRQKRNFKHEI